MTVKPKPSFTQALSDVEEACTPAPSTARLHESDSVYLVACQWHFTFSLPPICCKTWQRVNLVLVTFYVISTPVVTANLVWFLSVVIRVFELHASQGQLLLKRMRTSMTNLRREKITLEQVGATFLHAKRAARIW